MSTSTEPIPQEQQEKSEEEKKKPKSSPNNPQPKFTLKIEDLQPSDESIGETLHLMRVICFWHDQPWSKDLFFPTKDSHTPAYKAFLMNLVNFFKVRTTLLAKYESWWVGLLTCSFFFNIENLFNINNFFHFQWFMMERFISLDLELWITVMLIFSRRD